MRILFASSEVYPIAKVGGLADVAGSLPKALAARGHEVTVIMPRYGSIQGKTSYLGNIWVPMGAGRVEGAYLRQTYLDEERRVPVILVDHGRFFSSRKDLYAFPDDGLRFSFFSRAIIEVIRFLDVRPRLIHCHDWHTGLVPAYLEVLAADDPKLQGLRTVFTIHNLQYQGIFGQDVYSYTGLPQSLHNMEGLEFHGNFSCLKAGVVYGQLLNTVSPTYAVEMQSPEFGCGLNGLLQHHSGKLCGIVNGIDQDTWNPRTDPLIPVHFGPEDMLKKREMKLALQREAGLPPSGEVPIFSFIGRLVDQKGMDILMPILPRLLEEAQVLILGTGAEFYHRKLGAFQGKNSNLAIFLKYDEELAHRIYAGSDALLMPSWFEPCGLGQLIALRYGTIPVVRQTGGLADTVVDADGDPGEGTGFSFTAYRPEALLNTLKRAIRAYRDRTRWSRLMARAMEQDFSWKSSTEKYEKLYESAMETDDSREGSRAVA